MFKKLLPNIRTRGSMYQDFVSLDSEFSGDLFATTKSPTSMNSDS